MRSIHQRPAAAQSRRQAGHREGDLIVGAGQRSAIVTLVERKFRTTVLVPVPRDHTAQSVGDALIGAFGTMPAGLRRTLTWDQGNEMFHHERIEQHTGIKIYFCDPRSAWQRASNENVNGRLRQYFRGNRPSSLDLAPTQRRRRRAQRPPATLPRRPHSTPSHATMGPTDTTMIRNDRQKPPFVQPAVFRPRGLFGRVYWYSVVPFHRFTFGRLAVGIERHAAKAPTGSVERAA
jgi:IS30 family transposase